MTQEQFPGMPSDLVGTTEGVLITIWHNPETGYRQAHLVAFQHGTPSDEQTWENFGPFDLAEILEQHRARLSQLGFL